MNDKKMLLAKILIILLIIGICRNIYVMNKDPYSNSTPVLFKGADGTAITVEGEKIDPKLNGEDMKNYISSLLSLFDVNNIEDLKINKIQKIIDDFDIDFIYYPVVTAAQEKIDFADKYMKTKDKIWIEHYNNIELNEILAERFEKANVDYEFKEDKTLIFWYHETK